ncbi:MurR/RpiR family transcriptional regulator [Mediterraneibacter sp. ICN-202921]|uniref:MurR/RpiR family transcriptional regulator n=1 Tax=Mediterraneibacter sp. ICN-202921 TaxID=3134657 RepID=UPI0030C0DCB8
MLSNKLRELHSTLTYSEIRIANYILANKNNLDILTSRQLADAIGVSQSTITRFSQKMGYSSIRSLLLDFKIETLSTTNDFEIQEHESNIMTCEKMKDLYIQTIESTFQSIKDSTLDNIADRFTKANKILCFGTYNSQLMVHYLSNKLREIGLNSYCENDFYTTASILRDMTSSDVVFLISHSGKSLFTLRIAEIAKSYGIPIISIVGSSQNKLGTMSTITLESSSFDIPTTLNNSAIKCSQLYLLDSIFFSIFKRNFAAYDRLVNKMYETLEIEIGQRNISHNRVRDDD